MSMQSQGRARRYVCNSSKTWVIALPAVYEKGFIGGFLTPLGRWEGLVVMLRRLIMW